MSLLFRKAEERSISFQDLWGAGGPTPAKSATIGAALRLVPVYSATALIADQIALAPLSVYEKKAGAVPSKVDVQPKFVTDPGFDQLDLYSWKFQALTSCLLRGNAYGLILEVDPRGIPSKVMWLKPDDVEVVEVVGQPAKFYWKGKLIPRQDLIHIPGYVVPGSVVGMSPIGLFRSQIETGMEAQEFGRKYFRRGTVPSGVLQNVSRAVPPEMAKAAKDRFVASVSSSEPFVTGSDWQYTAIAIPPGDASFLTGIKATANQIAAVYRVAPEEVGGETNGTSLTYKNLEQDQIKFAVRTLQPWATRFEAVLNRYLPANQYTKFNLDVSARADLTTRYTAHQIAIGAGFETLDEARALEEREPLTPEELDQYMAISSPIKPAIPS